jgi:hypothetical protein
MALDGEGGNFPQFGPAMTVNPNPQPTEDLL